MWILGLAHSHNGAVALIRDGLVVAAVQLERLERIKRYPLGFSRAEVDGSVKRAIDCCVRQAGITVSELSAVAATTPWRLPTVVYWPHPEIRWISHHYAHAEYVLHYAGNEPALVLVIDSHGTWEDDRKRLSLSEAQAADAHVFSGDTETVSAYRYDGRNLELVYRLCGARGGPHGWLSASIGQGWEFASSLCIGPRDQAGKVMGLAAYGKARASDRLMRLDSAGRVVTNPEVLLDASLPFRDIACMTQVETTRVLLELLAWLKARFPADRLCYTGGVALNIVANAEIIRSGLFSAVQMNGSCEDQGTAIGAALALHAAMTGERRREPVEECYGADYAQTAVLDELKRLPVAFDALAEQRLIADAAERLAAGEILGWFQGRSELGPRALGSRSILANPLIADTKERLNGRIKRREPFRPYAAVVPLEAASTYFDLDVESPVMLIEARVKDETLAAITHVNGTARVQTVTRASNPRLHGLLHAFGAITGKPVLLNTSLNTAGEPIVETPQDALLTLLRTELDCLFLNDFRVLAK
jgi:carbamoyltransferase